MWGTNNCTLKKDLGFVDIPCKSLRYFGLAFWIFSAESWRGDGGWKSRGSEAAADPDGKWCASIVWNSDGILLFFCDLFSSLTKGSFFYVSCCSGWWAAEEYIPGLAFDLICFAWSWVLGMMPWKIMHWSCDFWSATWFDKKKKNTFFLIHPRLWGGEKINSLKNKN